MFLKNSSEFKIWLKNKWGKLKRASFSHYSYTATQIHTHTHFFCYFTQGKKWLQKSFSQKPLRKLLQWQTNTLGASSSQERDFFSQGQYFIFKTSESVLRTTSKKSAFGLTSLFEQKDWYRGMYTSMQKYREGQRSRNRPSLPAKLEGDAFSNDFTVCLVQ